MRVLFTSTSGQGHLQPLIPLIRGFAALGHETMVVAPKRVEATLAGLGTDYRLGDDPTEQESERVWSLFPTLPRREASRLVEREWFAEICCQALLPVVGATASKWSPALIVRESCEYAGAVVADQLGAGVTQVGISTAAAEWSVLHDHVQPYFDTRYPGLTQRLSGAPYLTTFPASLDPSPYPSTFRYRSSVRHDARVLPNWWPGNSAPLVYLTLGTVASAMDHAKALLRSALAALSDLEIRVLLTVGTAMTPDEFGPTPANVHVESWVDQNDALAQTSVVVCHGGSGTTFAALAAGVPLVFVPMFADQPTNAQLVVSAGAGLSVSSGGASSDDNVDDAFARINLLRNALSAVLTQTSYRDAAASIGREIAGHDDVAELIERLLRASRARRA